MQGGLTEYAFENSWNHTGRYKHSGMDY